MSHIRRNRVLIADIDLCLPHVVKAPQIAATCQLHAAIDVAVLSLLAAYPNLDTIWADPRLDGAEPAVCFADAIIVHGRALQTQLDRYHQSFLTEHSDSFE